MKKCLVLLFCLIAGVAHALTGEHYNFSDDLVSAFESCTPYKSMELYSEDLAKNKISEQYTSIDVVGKQGDKCVFDLILQMQSVRFYGKTVKRCKATSSQQKALSEGIKNVDMDGGRRFDKALIKIIDKMGCSTISDINEDMPGYSNEKGYMLIEDE